MPKRSTIALTLAALLAAGTGSALRAQSTSERLATIERAIDGYFDRHEGGTALRIRDPQSRTVGYLGASSNTNRGFLNLSDGLEVFAYLGSGRETGGGLLSLSDAKGERFAFLGHTTAGSPRLSLYRNGTRTVRVEAADAGGELSLLDNSGNTHLELEGDRFPAIRMSQEDEGVTTLITAGFARFMNASGDSAIYIGTSAEQSGIVSVYDPSGTLALELHARAGGTGVVIVSGVRTHDYAEVFDLATRDGVIPGTVMSIATDGDGLEPSGAPYDPRAVGVISGAGGFTDGMRIGSRADGTRDLPVALSGQVYVRVSAEGGAIQPGDLLVTSSTRGVAMRATDHARAFGAVIGKALEPYTGDAPEGLVRMLVMVR